jgi:hypothetical protein
MTSRPKKILSKKKTEATEKSLVDAAKDAELFAAACKEASEHRENNKELREGYRKSPAKRKALITSLVADLNRVFQHKFNAWRGWSASRARYRKLGHYPEIFVTDLFGSHAEFERAAGLRDKRTTNKVRNLTARLHTEREIAAYGDECVKPHLGKWEKSYSSAKGIKHVLVGSDFHSNFVDPMMMRMWLDVIEMVKPDGIVFNGVLDFASISRYAKIPGAGSLNLQADLDFCRDNILRPSVERAGDAWRTFHIGNHEHRLIRHLADVDPNLSSLRCLQWDKLLDIGELDIELVFGGEWLAPGAKNRKDNIKRTWKVYYDSLVVTHGTSIAKNAASTELTRWGLSGTSGHTHRPMMWTQPTHANPRANWTSTPMMAGTPVGKDYMQGPSEWTMGFALFTIDPETRSVFPQLILGYEDGATFNGYMWRPTKEEKERRRNQWRGLAE